MLTEEQALFTPAEAAIVTRLPLKTINNAIDKKTIAARTIEKGGVRSRLVAEPALVYLSLERSLARDTTPSFRRKVFKAISSAPAKRVEKITWGR